MSVVEYASTSRAPTPEEIAAAVARHRAADDIVLAALARDVDVAEALRQARRVARVRFMLGAVDVVLALAVSGLMAFSRVSVELGSLLLVVVVLQRIRPTYS